MEKAEIIAHYHELKKQLGHRPTSTEFYNSLTNAKRILAKVFGSESWNKLVLECGDSPKTFSNDKSDFEEILIKYGNLFREIQKHPVEAEWNHRNYTPSVNGITKSHNIKWSNMPQRFKDYFIGNPEWLDVINLIFGNDSFVKIKSDNLSPRLPLDIQNYIPPIVQDLIELSYDESQNLDFERKVNKVFEMLGFEIKSLGQGTGRKPDGIALSKINPRYAILIDSKSRGEGYRFGTDDRAFIEYINTYSKPLKNDGFDKIYFIVISSNFTSIPESSIKRLALETHIPITFLNTQLLLKILANKIKKPRFFDLNTFRDLLVENGEVSETNVDKFFSKLIKNNTI